MKSKKGQIAAPVIALVTIAVVFVVVILVMTFGSMIAGDTADSIGKTACAARTDTKTLYNTTSNLCYNTTGGTGAPNTYDWNTTMSGMEGMDNMSAKFPTLGTIIIAATIISVLVIGFWGAIKNSM